MLKVTKNPYGFKDLLVYKKSEELQLFCRDLTSKFPKTKTIIALADQMDRSARSVKQNIVEGWKRNSTKEYYDFLGFSIGANTELEEDCNDIWKGIYFELMGLRGIMGNFVRGGKKGIARGGEKGDYAEVDGIENKMGNYARGGEKGDYAEVNGTGNYVKIKGAENKIENYARGGNGNESLSSHLNPLIPFDIEKLKFYPIDESLPPVIKLKLKCKELNFLFQKLQNSLALKMGNEGTLSLVDKFKIKREERAHGEKCEDKLLEMFGLEKLENGKVVKKGERGK